MEFPMLYFTPFSRKECTCYYWHVTGTEPEAHDSSIDAIRSQFCAIIISLAFDTGLSSIIKTENEGP